MKGCVCSLFCFNMLFNNNKGNTEVSESVGELKYRIVFTITLSSVLQILLLSGEEPCRVLTKLQCFDKL